MAAARLFQHSAAYAKHRPTYPEAVFELLATAAAGNQLAVDVATGTGQALPGLASRFERVVAVEPSLPQLEVAQQTASDTVVCLEGTAEDFPETAGVADGSVDLVTAFQAAHWFDLDSFYANAARVLRPGGVCAVVGYGNMVIGLDDKEKESDDKDISEPAASSDAGEPLPPASDWHTQHARANAVVRHFYSDELGPYWDDRRRLVDAHYEGLEPSADAWSEVWRRDDLEIQREWDIDDIVGYLSSWSAYQTYRKQRPDDPDPLDGVFAGINDAFMMPRGTGFGIKWPLFIILARK